MLSRQNHYRSKRSESPYKVNLQHPSFRQLYIGDKSHRRKIVRQTPKNQQSLPERLRHTLRKNRIFTDHSKIQQIFQQPLSKHRVENQNHSIQFINAQYYGGVNSLKQPSGTGILLDDQFNFFLSNWKADRHMNGLTFIRFQGSGLTLYGTWVNGKMNGVQALSSPCGLKVFFHSRDTDIKSWDSPLIVLDYSTQVAYIVEIGFNENHQEGINESSQKLPSFDIVDRIPFNKLDFDSTLRHSSQPTVDPNSVLKVSSYNKKQIPPTKIPQFMFSPLEMINYISSNNDRIDLKFKKNSDRELFLDFPQYPPQENSHSLTADQILLKKSISGHLEMNEEGRKRAVFNRLSIVLDSSTGMTKSIGTYNEDHELNGVGISYGKQSKSILGMFKNDMIVREFKNDMIVREFKSFKYQDSINTPFRKGQNSCRNSIKNGNSKEKYYYSMTDQKVKDVLKDQHMKSLDYQHEVVYFCNLDRIVEHFGKIAKFVEIFELEYVRKYQKAKNTNLNSEDSGQQGISALKYEDDLFSAFEKQPRRNENHIKNTRKTGFIVTRSPSPIKNNFKQENSSARPHQKNTPFVVKNRPFVDSLHNKSRPVFTISPKNSPNSIESSTFHEQQTSKHKYSEAHYFRAVSSQEENLNTVRKRQDRFGDDQHKRQQREVYWKR